MNEAKPYLIGVVIGAVFMFIIFSIVTCNNERATNTKVQQYRNLLTSTQSAFELTERAYLTAQSTANGFANRVQQLEDNLGGITYTTGQLVSGGAEIERAYQTLHNGILELGTGIRQLPD